jgi:hypothetical protein
VSALRRSLHRLQSRPYRLAFASLLLAAAAWAGPSMHSAANSITRDVDNGGGSYSTSSNFQLTGSIAEAVAFTTSSSANNVLRSGFSTIAYYPNTPTAITPGGDLAISSVTLTWRTPGYDGNLGAAMPGSAYLIQVASASNLGVFANLTTVNVTIATSGVTVGTIVGGGVAGLSPNTPFFTQILLRDSDANVSVPFAASIATFTTLAAPAASLATTSVSSSAISLAWDPNQDPAGTAFVLQKSTDGVTFADVSTFTVTGASVGGLSGGGTYYFQVVAVNGNGIPASPSNIALVFTPSGPVPSTPGAFAASGGLLTVSLTWNQLPAALQGQGLAAYRLLRSTSSGAGFVQITTTTGAAYMDRPLAAGVTEYYKLIARDVGGIDSAPTPPVAAVPFTERPMEPLGVSAAPSSATVTLSWSPTKRFVDGQSFLSRGTPTLDELQGYSVYRSTDLCSPNYVQLSTLPISATSLTDANGGLNYYYRLFAFNSLGVSSNPVTVSALGEFDYFMDDCATRLVLDSQSQSTLNAATNGTADIRLIRSRRPQDVGNGIFQSVEWEPSVDGVTVLKNFAFPKPARIVLAFSESNGAPVPSTAPTDGFSPLAASAAGSAASVSDLGAYWFNGLQYVKMYGRIDPVAQTVSVDSPNPGLYQIRAQARAASAVFDVSNLSGRVITPNGDGLNDVLIFKYDPGPRNVVPEGGIFDLNGARVADMTPGLDPTTLTWNGRMNGRAVRSGVYAYRITGDGKTFTGTVVVTR